MLRAEVEDTVAFDSSLVVDIGAAVLDAIAAVSSSVAVDGN